MKLQSKATLSGIVAVVLSVAASTSAVLYLIKGELTDQAYAHQELKMRVFHDLLKQAGEVKMVEGKLMIGARPASEHMELVDHLAALVGGTATIFQGETRVATNVLKDDGSRAIGTPLVGVAKDVVINRAQPYRGEADILGVPYFTAYDPLLDAEGKAFGVIYVGVKQEEFFKSFRQLVLASVVAAGALSLVIGLLLAVAVRRLLARLAALAKAADGVSMGEGLDLPMTDHSNDEIGELSKSVDRLRNSMKEAMKRLESMS